MVNNLIFGPFYFCSYEPAIHNILIYIQLLQGNEIGYALFFEKNLINHDILHNMNAHVISLVRNTTMEHFAHII